MFFDIIVLVKYWIKIVKIFLKKFKLDIKVYNSIIIKKDIKKVNEI